MRAASTRKLELTFCVSLETTASKRDPMRTNPFHDTRLYLIGSTNDHEGSGVGLLLVILFWFPTTSRVGSILL